MAVQMLGRLNRQWQLDMLRPVYTMRNIQSGSLLSWKHISLVCRMLYNLITQVFWCVLHVYLMLSVCWKVIQLRPIGTLLFLILSVCKLEKLCVSIELKADLMGSVALELSHGSVTHHRTLGSHDSLIIWGIVWSLSIIKTNHRPAACLLSINVCLQIICPRRLRHSKSFVCLCVSVHFQPPCSSFCVSFFSVYFPFVSRFNPWILCLFLWQILRAQQHFTIQTLP